MKSKSEIVQYLRDHIVGAMHLGQIHPGDRLPSIRETAQQLGKNPRTVRAAYELLEREGIVTVRGRSGVHVAPQSSRPHKEEEKARWMSAFLAEVWTRRIPILNAADEVRRFTHSHRITCGLVEEIPDVVVALAHELREDWGFEVEVISPDRVTETARVDFFAATSFIASLVDEAVQTLGKPLVVLTVNANLQNAITQSVNSGRLTVVATDERFGHRIRAAYAPDHPDRIRLILAEDREEVARLDPDDPILLTRAAHNIIGSSPALTIYPHSPTISAETARMLGGIVVGLNVRAMSS
jgi:GntR family transcriptional regulator